MIANARLREVQLQINNANWKELTIHDESGRKYAVNQTSKSCGGGRTLTQADGQPYMLCWKIYENIAEFVVEGLYSGVKAGCLRVVCPETNIVGNVSIIELSVSTLLAFATTSAVHILEVGPQSNNKCMFDKARLYGSYAVSSGSAVCHCDASVDGISKVLFAVTKEDGSTSLVLITDGAAEEVELKQTTLINKLWKGVIPSMIRSECPCRGQDDKGNSVGAVFVADGDSQALYMLTNDFHLKKWSLQTWECLSDWNLTNFVTINQSSFKALQIKAFDSPNGKAIGVLSANGNSYQVLLLSVNVSKVGEKPTAIAALDCGTQELVDFELISDAVFALGRNLSGDNTLRYVVLENGDGWRDVYMQPCCPSQLEIPDYADPREVFTSYLFHPNRFNVNALAKVTAVMRHEPLATFDNFQQIEELKCKAAEAVEQAIRSCIYSDEISNEDYRHLQIEIWQKFYSDVVQYHEVFTQPLGLVNGEDFLPVCIVRKGTLSFLRLCDPIEQQILYPSDSLDSGQPLDQDVVTIMQALDRLRVYLPDLDDTMYAAIVNGTEPLDIVNQIIASLKNSPEHTRFKEDMDAYLQNIDQPLECIQILLQLLDLVRDLSQKQDYASSIDDNLVLGLSSTGQNLLCSSVEGMLESRFGITCALTVFTVYLNQLNNESNPSQKLQDEIKDLLSSMCLLSHAYTVVLWVCRLSSYTTSIEMNESMLEALRITNEDNFGLFSSRDFGMNTIQLPVLRHFISSIGGAKVTAVIGDDYMESSSCIEKHASLVRAVAQALWPISSDLTFAEYLLARNDTTTLEIYCYLLNGWCEHSQHFRLFILGQCYLLQSEPRKAYRCFELALKGICDETVYQSKYGLPAGQLTDEVLQVEQSKFCLKVINLFEYLSFSEEVIQMALYTIETFSDSSSDIPALWTKIFKHSLELNRHDDAYRAILANPDSNRKMDCLRQFVSILCDKGLLETLVSYPYKDSNQQDLRPQVESILKSKARSVDLTVKNYYDLLYSFYIFNNDLRSAASVMYECAERLSRELTGLATLQKQAKCYLACINTLHCVSPDYAWLLPTLFADNKYAERKSPKRTSEGSQKIRQKPATTNIITLSDIEKEYLLVNMRLRLLRINPNHVLASSGSDPVELVAHLSSAGMYDEAIEVSQSYDLDLSPVFDSLTYRCIHMCREPHANTLSDDQNEATKWLSYNQLPVEHTYSSFCDQAWMLLRSHLQKYENLTKYHRCIATKLLANSVALPEWLIFSYKIRNVAELLRLYIIHDMFEEATELAIEYLKALTGDGFERFGLKDPINGTMLPATVLVPYTSIDVLLKTLSELKQDTYYDMMFKELRSSIDHYFKELATKCSDASERYKSSSRMLRSTQWRNH